MSIYQPAQRAFADLPTYYAGLCRVLLPRPIRSEEEYSAVVEIADLMAVHEPEFNTDQEDYFDLLCSLIESWDREHVSWAHGKPHEILRYLLEEHSLDEIGLAGILGAAPEVGSMVLRGEQDLTVKDARLLGARFGLPAGVFIE